MNRLKLLFALLTLTSCTVKESRDGGPCTLYLDSGGMCPLTVSLWHDGVPVGEESSAEHRVFDFLIERGQVTVTAVSLTDRALYDEGTVTIDSQAPVDSIFAYRDTLDCDCEYLRDTVQCWKQFATVNMTLNISPRHERFPDSLMLISAWNGFDVRTLRAIPGSYAHTFQCTGVVQSFRVLRQGDDTLLLRLYRRGEGIVDDVSLGALLAKAGYNWTERNLMDIDITVEQAGARIFLVIADWNTGDPIEIEI